MPSPSHGTGSKSLVGHLVCLSGLGECSSRSGLGVHVIDQRQGSPVVVGRARARAAPRQAACGASGSPRAPSATAQGRHGSSINPRRSNLRPASVTDDDPAASARSSACVCRDAAGHAYLGQARPHALAAQVVVGRAGHIHDWAIAAQHHWPVASIIQAASQPESGLEASRSPFLPARHSHTRGISSSTITLSPSVARFQHTRPSLRPPPKGSLDRPTSHKPPRIAGCHLTPPR